MKEKLTVIRTHAWPRKYVYHLFIFIGIICTGISNLRLSSYKERFISESRPTRVPLYSPMRGNFTKGLFLLSFPFLFFSFLFFYSTVAKATIRLPAMPAVTTINNRNRSRIGWESEHRQKQARTANWNASCDSKLLVYVSQSSSRNIINLERRIRMDATSLSLSIPHRNRVTNVQPQTGTPQRTLGTPLASRSNLSFKLFTVSPGLSRRFLIGEGRKYPAEQVRCN